jgi:EAL domain-containing protein (putative c-di-GMP-specific phosphodiesterase class I)
MLAWNAIEIHFQPIISGRQREILSVEALSRGHDNAGTLVPPALLFRLAAQDRLSLEFDRACRRAALERFVPLYHANNKLVLFLNTHPSMLVEDVEQPHVFADLVRQYGLDPRNIAVEILEADVTDTVLLRAAAEAYHRHGFLVVMDDVGAGYSNLDRMLQIKPDMLKADRTLVRDLHRDSYKQGVFKALVLLGERIGGWVVTEGVKTRDEAVVALDLGADMLQGFFFGRPHPFFGANERNATLERVIETAEHFRRYTVEHFTMLQAHQQHRRALVQHIAAQLANASVDTFEQQLRAAIRMDPDIESVCVLDAGGRQITETVHNAQPFETHKTIIFEPPVKGTDHR